MYEDESDFLDINASDINIPGVDAELGSGIYGGEMDIYISALRSFSTHIPAALNDLGNVSEETLPDYAATVHGLKGTCAGIGAEDIKGRAYDLEMKAKAGDLAGVLALNKGLVEDAEKLVSDVQAWLDRLVNQAAGK